MSTKYFSHSADIRQVYSRYTTKEMFIKLFRETVPKFICKINLKIFSLVIENVINHTIAKFYLLKVKRLYFLFILIKNELNLTLIQLNNYNNNLNSI